MSSRYGTVPPIGKVYETPVGRFVRLRVWDNERDLAVLSARKQAESDGLRVLDIASVSKQPFDVHAIGRGEPTGGHIVEVQVS